MSNTMLIKLIEMPGKTETYLDAGQIRAVAERPDNPMICLIIQNVMTPNGFLSTEVLGRAGEIARQVNAARAGKDLLVQ